MKLTIHKSNGGTRAVVGLNAGAKCKFVVGSEDYITLPFTTSEPVAFGIGDYVDMRNAFPEEPRIGKVFVITELPQPTYNTGTGGYKYDLKLEAYYRSWKNRIFKYITKDGREASWNLTATLDKHMSVFLENIDFQYGGLSFNYNIDTTIVKDEARLLSYTNTDMISALNMMAEKWECEWWVEGNIINFGKKDSGTSVKIEMDVEASNMSRSSSKGMFANRLFVFGSQRNLPINYRTSEQDVTVNGVVQKRLMLPLKDTVGNPRKPYIDAYKFNVNGEKLNIGDYGYEASNNIEMPASEVVEAVLILEEVYPKLKQKISGVQTYEKEIEEDGKGTGEFETFYQFKIPGFHFSREYLLKGVDLAVRFTSGRLNGMTFGLAFNPNGFQEKTSSGGWNEDAQLFEIIANETYGRRLPDTILLPADGNEVILEGWDSTKLADTELLPNAENELLEKGKEYIKKAVIDDGTYNVTLASSWVCADEVHRTFELGQKVDLINETFFEDVRKSRIIGWELNLDKPYDAPIYTIGESTQYSKLGALETKVEEIQASGVGGAAIGGNGVYLIRINDTTVPTDSNAYSARRANEHFLRKDKDDKTPCSLEIGDNLKVAHTSDLGKQAIVEAIYNQLFAQDGETGYKLWIDELLKSHLIVDHLVVRLSAVFTELEIRKMSYLGGNYIFSAAGCKVERVETAGLNYRCYFMQDNGEVATQNLFKVNDLAICQTFNIKEGVHSGVKNRYYWRKVVAVGDNYIDLSASDCDTSTTNDTPNAGDEIIQLGNTTDKTRQGAIAIETTGEDAPALKIYSGIDTYSLTGKCKTKFSPTTGNKVTGELIALDGNGSETNVADTIAELRVKNNEISATVGATSQEYRNLVPNSYLGICTNKNIDRIRKVWLTAGRTYTWSASAHIGKDAREELEIGIYNDIEPGNAEHFESYMYFANQGHDKTESFQIYPTYTGWYYIDINYYAEFTVEYAVVNWIQIEDGSIATPWTPNKDDAQVNANLWPLEKDCIKDGSISGQHELPNGTNVNVHYCGDVPNNLDIMRCNYFFNNEKADSYTLSFYAKGENSAVYVAIFDMLIGVVYDNGNVQSEWAGEPKGQNGSPIVYLTDEWKRYEIHLTFAPNITDGTMVLVHIPLELDGVKQGKTWLCGAKLEHGGRATEYGIGERDFLATGFNIRENRFQVNANNFEVQNLQGQRTMGIDADGNVMVSKLAVEQANPDWKSGIFAYIDETGNPCLRGVDAYGNIRWRFTGEIHTDTTDDVGMTITPKSSCYANFNDMGDIRTYTATYDIYVMVQNKSNAAVTYTANSIACRARLGNGQYESEYVNVPLRNSITVPAGDMAEAHFFARSVKLTYDKTTDRPVGYEAFYSGQGLTAMALYLAHGMEIKNMYDIMVYDGSAMPTNLIE